MVLCSRGRQGYTSSEVRDDALVQKLREIILVGRDKNLHDRLRAIRYNFACWMRGKPYRAPVR